MQIDGAEGIKISQQIQVADVSPGVFTLNRAGLVAATILRVSGGNQANEAVYQLDGLGEVVARPVDLGESSNELLYLTIYGTGFRVAGTAGVTVTLDGEAVQVLFAGAQGGFLGLDQANVRVPQSFAGRGEVELILTAGDLTANPVRLTYR